MIVAQHQVNQYRGKLYVAEVVRGQPLPRYFGPLTAENLNDFLAERRALAMRPHRRGAKRK